ncbi:PqqD family protein [Clostridium cadaveris]|uniref:Coenzyme PQQ synthesis protein D (PqqD) n=1 Tax=Clostridium cadaveris TaxID=1529 RepID=A0A1I2JTK8_9CLOT|nr:PqqD family protein [Clostridium cadaveris]SFF57448.1 Coenzyme PQQ synthesis protein D (PqqD) [Clostridium cadaveris]
MNDKLFDLICDRKPMASNFKMRKDGEYYIALPQNIGVLISLNNTSAYILSMCNGENTLKDILDSIYKNAKINYSVTKLKYDILKCTRDLESMQLICGYN